MQAFEKGYEFLAKGSSGIVGSLQGKEYIANINREIDKLEASINQFKGNMRSVGALKGNVAEHWHSGTFNINAAIKGSGNRTFVDESNKFASVDVSTNFGDSYGLKYYKDGIESAKMQAQVDKSTNQTIYGGQIRLIPKDQMEEAIKWLERKIAEESVKRPEQVQRYQETLNLLTDKIRSSDGIESIPLSKNESELYAELGKEGAFNARKVGVSTEELVKFKDILNNSMKAGVTAATISVVLKTAPEIYKAIDYLVQNGHVDKEQFKKIGFAAITGAGEGCFRGAIAAVITGACEAGHLGTHLKGTNPVVIGALTVVVMNVVKQSYLVATKKIEIGELVDSFVRDVFMTSGSFMTSSLFKLFIPIPVFSLLLGSFVGSVLGDFVYNATYKTYISFCIDTGFTLFGVVKQDYNLPKEIMESIGIKVFEYEKFQYQTFEYNQFNFNKFEHQKFNYSTIGIKILRRGVIGVNRIGYVS